MEVALGQPSVPAVPGCLYHIVVGGLVGGHAQSRHLGEDSRNTVHPALLGQHIEQEVEVLEGVLSLAEEAIHGAVHAAVHFQVGGLLREGMLVTSNRVFELWWYSCNSFFSSLKSLCFFFSTSSQQVLISSFSYVRTTSRENIRTRLIGLLALLTMSILSTTQQLICENNPNPKPIAEYPRSIIIL